MPLVTSILLSFTLTRMQRQQTEGLPHDVFLVCSEVPVAAHLPGASTLAAVGIGLLYASGNCTAAAVFSSG